MTVYVDDSRNPFGNMFMCHMMADSLEELHKFAKKVGLKRQYFQSSRFPHYDLCLSKRALALRLGATSCTTRDLVRRYRVHHWEKDRRVVPA
jgi:hypothetical protein